MALVILGKTTVLVWFFTFDCFGYFLLGRDDLWIS